MSASARIQTVLGALAGLLLLAACAAALHWLLAPQRFPVSRVQITGNLKNTTSAQIEKALPRAADMLHESGLKDRIRLVASGKLVTSARAAWALCVGADFVNTARGFMFSLGCIQALRCHQNTCPTGVTTHNKRLQRALVVEEKFQRVANYAMNMNREVDMIAHSCGVRHARELKREHVRLVQASGQSVALNMLYPYPEPKAKVRAA